jgi:fructose-1,6-bisphosphatase II
MTENVALNVLPWLGRGDKEKADTAACDAITGVFDRGRGGQGTVGE